MSPEEESPWLNPAASLAELRAAANRLSKEGRLAELFNVLNRLVREPNHVFYRGDRVRAEDPPYANHDSSGRRSIDIEQMRSAPRQDLLRELISWRFGHSVRRACSLGDVRVMRLMLMPVNPLLVCTALARSMVIRKFPEMVADYINGAPMGPPKHYFPALLGRPQYETDQLLAEHLGFEEELLEAFCILGYRYFDIAVGQDLSDQSQWRDGWLSINRLADNGDYKAKSYREEIRWATWLLANPVLYWCHHESVQALMFGEGFASNKEIHDARREAEATASEVDRKFNQILREEAAAEVRKSRLENAQRARSLERRVVDRARRFYLWNPCEIDARLVGNTAAAAIMRMSEEE